jgi:NADH:ubiquinone oxidoreductase subunit 2 (subunit N)
MVYYLRIVMAMYFRDGKEAELAGGAALKFVAVACLVITLFFGILPTPLIDEAQRSGAGVAKRIANARR